MGPYSSRDKSITISHDLQEKDKESDSQELPLSSLQDLYWPSWFHKLTYVYDTCQNKIFYMCMCVCIYVCICMYMCVCMCMCMCIYIYMYICMCVCIYIYIYIYICIYVSVCICMYIHIPILHLCILRYNFLLVSILKM